MIKAATVIVLLILLGVLAAQRWEMRAQRKEIAKQKAAIKRKDVTISFLKKKAQEDVQALTKRVVYPQDNRPTSPGVH